ncbi:MAG: DUF5615 family PIN-like protein [Planctomycetota bacterium]
MRFLIDQDVYATTVRFVKDLGHDVLQVAELGLSQEEDTALIKKAFIVVEPGRHRFRSIKKFHKK